MPSIYTLSNLAQIMGVPAHRVSYAIRVHALEPTARVGKGIRLWCDDDLPRIREALRKTGALESAAEDHCDTEVDLA
jgi:DNA-binding transcriptional MerR regulator